MNQFGMTLLHHLGNVVVVVIVVNVVAMGCFLCYRHMFLLKISLVVAEKVVDPPKPHKPQTLQPSTTEGETRPRWVHSPVRWVGPRRSPPTL